MNDRRILTAESVTEGHPDKVCDAIADQVLDACLAEDPGARVDSAGGAMVFFSWSPNAESLSLPESASSSHAF